MGQYNVLHIEKQSGACSSKMEDEEERTEAVTFNADKSMSYLNFSLRSTSAGKVETCKLKWSPMTKQQRIDNILLRQRELEYIDKQGRKRKKSAAIRKDAVTHINMIISGSHERMNEMLVQDLKDRIIAERQGKDKSTVKSRIAQWAADNYKWLAERCGGADNIVSFCVHLDEATPHIHATIVPMYDGRLSAKKFVNGPQGLAKLRTEHAEIVGKKYGLERGIAGSKAKHERIRDFYRDLERIGRVEDISCPDVRSMPDPAVIPYALDTPPLLGRDTWRDTTNKAIAEAIEAQRQESTRAAVQAINDTQDRVQQAIDTTNVKASSILAERNRLRTEVSQLRAEVRSLKTQLAAALAPKTSEDITRGWHK